ncbi:MAG: ATP-binding protein [Prevotella sp.]|nr:ATP-binding protein [Bacteroides sp.]MCM1365812.1 ATP-binding protein [Prevotella sp.]MCM1436496.1 ATP-binding protein [Prevotella sp.]
MKSSPEVILICGVSGSGKTYMSRKFEQQGYVRLCVDELMWELHGCDFMMIPSEERRKMTLEAEDILRKEMKEQLSLGKKVVIDSCLCKRFKREEFERVAKESGANVRRYYLTAPKSVLTERLRMREGKNPNEIKVSEDELDRFMDNFEIPQKDEGYLTVDSFNGLK